MPVVSWLVITEFSISLGGFFRFFFQDVRLCSTGCNRPWRIFRCRSEFTVAEVHGQFHSGAGEFTFVGEFGGGDFVSGIRSVYLK